MSTMYSDLRALQSNSIYDTDALATRTGSTAKGGEC